MREIDFLLSDLDGTLLTPEHQVSPRSLAAIAALRERGVRFSVASSRPPLGMRDTLAQLRHDFPFAAFNGAAILAPDLTLLESLPLEAAVARRVLADIAGLGLSAWVFRGLEWWLTDPQGARVRREAEVVGFEPQATRDLDSKAEGTLKIMAVSLDPELVLRAERELQRRWKGQAQVSRSHAAYIDITHPLAHKGTALRRLAELAGTSAERSAAIGDMPNDLEMFAVAGFSVAMGGADEEIKAKASAVTASHREEGFALAVERYLLGR